MIRELIKKLDLSTWQADKKSLYYMAIALVVALFVFACLLYYMSFIPKPITVIDEEALMKLKRQKMIERQLQELNEARGKVKPLTAKEIQSQLKDLNNARQLSQPLTEQDIQKQLDELNKLRQ
jgi:hypothetical protein